MAIRGWSAGKTAGVIAAVFAGLLIVCCGLSWAFKSDELKDTFAMVGSGVEMGQKLSASQNQFDELLVERFGDGVRWQLVQGASEGILMIGLPEGSELPPDGALDGAWADFAEAYAEGSPPVSALALGAAGDRLGGKHSQMGGVHGWTHVVVGVDDLAERTGVAAPPQLEFFERIQGMQRRGSGVKVEIR